MIKNGSGTVEGLQFYPGGYHFMHFCPLNTSYSLVWLYWRTLGIDKKQDSCMDMHANIFMSAEIYLK